MPLSAPATDAERGPTESQYRDYQKTHSGANKDEFLGKLLSGEIRSNS